MRTLDESGIREAEIEALDAHKRGVAEAPVLYRASGYAKEHGEDGEQVFVASEESEDRMGDVIEVKGWQLDNFKKNPVVMWAHDYRIAPLGTAPKLWVDDKQLLNLVGWDDADPYAQFIKGKYERKIMRAESVGFRPLEFEPMKEADAKGMFPSFRFTKTELLEISLVPIPAHPAALRKAMGDNTKFMIIMPSEVEPTVIDPAVTAGTGNAGGLDIEPKAVSRAEKGMLAQAAKLINQVIAAGESDEGEDEPEDDDKGVDEPDYLDELLEGMRKVREE